MILISLSLAKVCGVLLTKDKVEGGNGAELNYTCNFVDYGAYLDKVQISGEFIGKTDKTIIGEVFASSGDLADYDAVTYVNTIQTIDRVVFNRKPVRDVLN